MTVGRSRMLQSVVSAVACALVVLAAGPLLSQTQAPPSAVPSAPVVLNGKLERIEVPGKSLEGNLMGESASPDVSITPVR